MAKAILMNAKDNVATMLADAGVGDAVKITLSSGKLQGEVQARQNISFGHKISVKDIAAGDKIIKYGEVIGEATMPITTGDHVHIHNIRSMTWGRFG